MPLTSRWSVDYVLAKEMGMATNFWKDRNVLLTGCTGLLGSWLAQTLVEREANLIGLIRDSVPRSNLYLSGISKRMTVVRGEVEDEPLLERTLNEYEVDSIFHLAAQTIVTIANRNPLSTFETNIKGTWNILEAARRSSLVSRVIVASSDKAYGSQEILPYDERTPLEGRHPYDVSKSCADLICQSYHNTYGLPVCITRCGNLYGGGDLNFNRIVPGTIRSLMNGERPVIRSDGLLVRDYFYVLDGVEAYMTLAEGMDERKIHGEAFNFSNERPLSVLELVDTLIEQMEADVRPHVLGKASNEIRHQYLSAAKAREVLGWRPSYTLQEGLDETIRWYGEFLRRD
ncbi:MAG: GDP-mannose 4,6-dehydratase [Methanotrichaceae archaeon]|nr:GDP-mannose 4,6-dehydratase [Methanotrichaceae archaeon]